MVKLYARTRIVLPAAGEDGEELVVERGKVFDATVDQAKQFDALPGPNGKPVARPATAEEIKAARAEEDKANGIVTADDAKTADAGNGRVAAPPSGAPGDPNSAPKAK